MPLTPYRVVIDKPKLNILLYGPPGVGKTTLACSAQEHPDLSPVLVANFEGGLLSVASRADIDAVDIHSISEMDELFWLLRNKREGFDKYKTIIIDSGSEMQTLAMEETTRGEIEKAQRQGKKTERTIDEYEIQTYGRVGAQVSRLMRWYRDLDINTIITALPRSTFAQGADQRTAAPREVAPKFTASLATAIMGYADMVWYLGDQGGRKVLLTSDNGIYRAKTRGYNFGLALGQIHPDPWLPNIYELLLKSEAGNAKATQVVNSAPLQAVDIFDQPLPYEPEPEVAPQQQGGGNGV